jgi:hypothetical protein
LPKLRFRMGKSPPFTVVKGSSSAPEPAATLGDAGRTLWDRILSAYDIQDPGGLEMLTQACHAADRAARLARVIDEQGEVIHTKTGLRSHPCIRDEIQARGFIVRTLAKLGLDVEPVRPVGRPPRGIGWTPP